MGFRDEEVAATAKLKARLADSEAESARLFAYASELRTLCDELRQAQAAYRSPANKLKALVVVLVLAFLGCAYVSFHKYKAMKAELAAFDSKVEAEFQLRMEAEDATDACHLRLRNSRNRSAVVFGSPSLPPECVTVCPGSGGGSINVEKPEMSCYCEDRLR